MSAVESGSISSTRAEHEALASPTSSHASYLPNNNNNENTLEDVALRLFHLLHSPPLSLASLVRAGLLAEEEDVHGHFTLVSAAPAQSPTKGGRGADQRVFPTATSPKSVASTSGQAAGGLVPQSATPPLASPVKAEASSTFRYDDNHNTTTTSSSDNPQNKSSDGGSTTTNRHDGVLPSLADKMTANTNTRKENAVGSPVASPTSPPAATKVAGLTGAFRPARVSGEALARRLADLYAHHPPYALREWLHKEAIRLCCPTYQDPVSNDLIATAEALRQRDALVTLYVHLYEDAYGSHGGSPTTTAPISSFENLGKEHTDQQHQQQQQRQQQRRRHQDPEMAVWSRSLHLLMGCHHQRERHCPHRSLDGYQRQAALLNQAAAAATAAAAAAAASSGKPDVPASPHVRKAAAAVKLANPSAPRGESWARQTSPNNTREVKSVALHFVQQLLCNTPKLMRLKENETRTQHKSRSSAEKVNGGQQPQPPPPELMSASVEKGLGKLQHNHHSITTVAPAAAAAAPYVAQTVTFIRPTSVAQQGNAPREAATATGSKTMSSDLNTARVASAAARLPSNSKETTNEDLKSHPEAQAAAKEYPDEEHSADVQGAPQPQRRPLPVVTSLDCMLGIDDHIPAEDYAASPTTRATGPDSAENGGNALGGDPERQSRSEAVAVASAIPARHGPRIHLRRLSTSAAQQGEGETTSATQNKKDINYDNKHNRSETRSTYSDPASRRTDVDGSAANATAPPPPQSKHHRRKHRHRRPAPPNSSAHASGGVEGMSNNSRSSSSSDDSSDDSSSVSLPVVGEEGEDELSLSEAASSSVGDDEEEELSEEEEEEEKGSRGDNQLADEARDHLQKNNHNNTDSSSGGSGHQHHHHRSQEERHGLTCASASAGKTHENGKGAATTAAMRRNVLREEMDQSSGLASRQMSSSPTYQQVTSTTTTLDFLTSRSGGLLNAAAIAPLTTAAISHVGVLTSPLKPGGREAKHELDKNAAQPEMSTNQSDLHPQQQQQQQQLQDLNTFDCERNDLTHLSNPIFAGYTLTRPFTLSELSTTAAQALLQLPYYAQAHELNRLACLRGRSCYQDPYTNCLILTSLFLEQLPNCYGEYCKHCPHGEVCQRRQLRPRDAHRSHRRHHRHHHHHRRSDNLPLMQQQQQQQAWRVATAASDARQTRAPAGRAREGSDFSDGGSTISNSSNSSSSGSTLGIDDGADDPEMLRFFEELDAAEAAASNTLPASPYRTVPSKCAPIVQSSGAVGSALELPMQTQQSHSRIPQTFDARSAPLSAQPSSSASASNASSSDASSSSSFSEGEEDQDEQHRHHLLRSAALYAYEEGGDVYGGSSAGLVVQANSLRELLAWGANSSQLNLGSNNNDEGRSGARQAVGDITGGHERGRGVGLHDGPHDSSVDVLGVRLPEALERRENSADAALLTGDEAAAVSAVDVEELLRRHEASFEQFSYLDYSGL